MKCQPVAALLLFAALLKSEGAVTYYSAANYKQRADSPILGRSTFAKYYVEDFENLGVGTDPLYQLTTPNATGWNGSSIGSDSSGVRQNYTSTDRTGFIWSSSSKPDESTKLPTGIHFDFSADAEGRFPDYVGAALLGRGLAPTGLGFNSIFVYDKNGQEVTSGEWLIPKINFNPPYADEDLFLNFEAIYVPGGISRIHFRDFLEVDHLTYGYSIPEISSIWLTAGAGFFLIRRRCQANS